MRRILICALFALNVLAQPSLERAVVLARQRRYLEARAALSGVAEPSAAAQRIAFHRLRAAIASGLGEGAVAADEMLGALALAPGDPTLLLGTAMAELQAGRLDDALRHVDDSGRSAAARALAGDIREKRGEFREAANAYRDAVALAPGVETYRIALALEFVQHQSFRLAIQVLERAAPLFPQSARIRALLGVAQYGDADTEDAVASLTDAVEIDPKLDPAFVYLARILLDSSGAPPARALRSICAWNDVVCASLKLRVARETNDPALQADAVAVLRRAPSGNAVAQCELGRAYQWMSRWRDARARMEACVALDPSPASHYRLGLVYTQLGLPGLARAQMELRDKVLRSMSEDAARRSAAVEAFRSTLK